MTTMRKSLGRDARLCAGGRRRRRRTRLVIGVRRQDHDLSQACRTGAGKTSAHAGARRRCGLDGGRTAPGGDMAGGISRPILRSFPRAIRSSPARSRAGSFAPMAPARPKFSATAQSLGDLGQDFGGGLFAAEVDYLVVAGMGARPGRYSLAPVKTRAACAGGHGNEARGLSQNAVASWRRRRADASRRLRSWFRPMDVL